MWYRLSEEKHILYNRTSETTDDRALNLFKDAVSQKPGESMYHYHLGMTQFKMGAKKAARQALKKSLELNPDHSESKNAVEVLQVLGAG
jgi:predicted TPR repeat methyltransferase